MRTTKTARQRLLTPLRDTLQWRHNGRDGVSNHQPRDCFLNRLFRRRSKKTSKLRVTGLCAGTSPATGEFSTQRASNAEMFPFDDVIMKHSIPRQEWHFEVDGVSPISIWYRCVPYRKDNHFRYRRALCLPNNILWMNVLCQCLYDVPECCIYYRKLTHWSMRNAAVILYMSLSNWYQR